LIVSLLGIFYTSKFAKKNQKYLIKYFYSSVHRTKEMSLQRTDHRIRLRIADLKNIFHGISSQGSIIQENTEIYCLLTFREEAPASHGNADGIQFAAEDQDKSGRKTSIFGSSYFKVMTAKM
jgi:hypothetical protein